MKTITELTMSNTKDMHEDGSRWRMLRGEQPEAIFRSWGATKVYEVDGAGITRMDRVFMIELEDGWHWAHSDGTSCGSTRETFGDLPDGNVAWLAHELRNALNRKLSAEIELQAATNTLTERQSAYARALAEAQKPSPCNIDPQAIKAGQKKGLVNG